MAENNDLLDQFTPATADDFAVIVEDPLELEPEAEEFKELDRKDLIEKLKAKEAEIAAQESVEAPNPTLETLNQNLEKMNEGLQGLRTPAQVQQGPPPMSPEEFKEKLMETMNDDPEKAMQMFYQQKLGPELQSLMQTNLYHSKKYLSLDPKRKDTAKKYERDIEMEVQNVDPVQRLRNPAVYEEAHDRVVSRNLDEVMAEKIDGFLEAKMKEAGLLPDKKDEKPEEKKVAFSESGTRPGPAGPLKEVKISPQEDAKIKQYAAAYGVDIAQARRTYIRHNRSFTR